MDESFSSSHQENKMVLFRTGEP